MDSDIFAEWLRRRGSRIVCSESSYWYEASPRVFQAFPFHWVIQPSERELRQLMYKYGMLALRYSAPYTAKEGLISYHTLLTGPYDLEQLNSKARTSVRAGLKNFQIEPITFDRLATEGWPLQLETLDRQGRACTMEQAEWERLCLTARDLPGFEAWAATCDGELAATEIAARIGDTVTLAFTQSKTQYLPKHVNNALIFSVCRDFLARPGVKSIFLGLQSLDAPSTVDGFKFQLGIKAAPVRQRVMFHPLLAPFAGPLMLPILKGLQKVLPDLCAYPKVEGMLRFYLDGKRKLDEQEWPKCMYDIREQIIENQVPEKEITGELTRLRTSN